MPALVAGIHVLMRAQRKPWMAGTSPAMTKPEFSLELGSKLDFPS